MTVREHLQRLFNNRGQLDERLIGEMPRESIAVWEVFVALARSRRSGMGAHALTFTDIEAWCRLYGVSLTPWELDTLIELDAVVMRHQEKKQRSNKE